MRRNPTRPLSPRRRGAPPVRAVPRGRGFAAVLCGAVVLGCARLPAAAPQPAPPDRPNIVYILADDLGYGDVHCLNPGRGRIATPCLDRLAGQGTAFTEAHSGSAVCTPTRYGILTGRYAWRTRLQNGVLNGYSRPLIAAGRLTVPAFLRQHGYHTACIGKWHLGMGLAKSPDDLTIANGPTTRGFDAFFGISASLDMPPYTFLEGDRVTVAPTARKKFLREGPAAPGFEAVDVLPALTRRATDHIARRAAAGRPFFLYLALTAPHTPIVPAAEWRGRSGLNPYADFVMQTDAGVGRVLAALDEAGIAANTLVIFTSDNGCAPAAGLDALERMGHFPSARRRGFKSDIWDGGHRIPFLARWPGRIPPGSRTGQLTCLTDLLATCADILDATLPDNAGEDSVSMLPAMLGTAAGPLREAAVHHSIDGAFAIRRGPWKLALCGGSGGWSKPPGPPAGVQLYQMSADEGERRNLADAEPATVARLTALLERYVADGRSTPGAPQRNDVPVRLRKAARNPR